MPSKIGQLYEINHLRVQTVEVKAKGISALNLGVVGRIVLSWVITLPVGAVLSIGFFFLFQAVFS